MRNSSVTQGDIAARVGLSQPQVASILSGNPKARASIDARKRVLEAAKSMGYVPHAGGRMLKTGRTNRVAISFVRPEGVSMSPDRMRIGLSVEAIAEALGDRGFSLQVRTHRNIQALLDWTVDAVRSRSFDGSVLIGPSAFVEEQGKLLSSLGHPFVAYGDYEMNDGWVCADFDHRRMIDGAVAKLTELGHSRIAYLGHGVKLSYAENYLAGYHAAMKARGLDSERPERLLLSYEDAESHWNVLREANEWFNMPPSERPTALAVGQGGSMLRYVVRLLLSKGCIVGDSPGDFAIAGPVADGTQIRGTQWIYNSWSHNAFIHLLTEQQLLPMIVDGAPRMRVLRFLPELERFVGRPEDEGDLSSLASE